MTRLSKTSVQYIKGVGPAKAELFENLGVQSVEDLLYLFPRRYEDRRNLTPIAQTKVGEVQTIYGKVVSVKSRRSYYTKKHVSEVVLDDASGRMVCVWFNQPYLENYFKKDRFAVCYGKVDMYKNRLQMVSPEYEIIEDPDNQDNLAVKRIVPIYPLTRGMGQRYLRKVIKAGLDKYTNDLMDELPVDLRNKHKLSNIKRSIVNIHFPEDFEGQEEAMRRISFEEFYFFQISMRLRRMSMIQKPGIAHQISDQNALHLLESFPFEFTGAQKRTISEISSDMKASRPMLRLLQGDVGSGKTVVAFYGCVMAALDLHQSALMAPTEILARQHYENIKAILKRSPFHRLRVALLVNGLKKGERDKVLKDLKNGEIDIVIGTHALLSEGVKFKNLSFVVVDEQHKFGVRQRAILGQKGCNPDILIMTATPIPRTLCITLYGDLDLSIIDEMPPGRGVIKTKMVTEETVAAAYRVVRRQVKAGRQAYVVYPIIEESETLDLKAAQAMYKSFVKKEFKDFKVGLVHGQMKKDDVQKTMEAFKAGKIDILVATTVLEVGLDVPNASVMLVEHAERFGLAQLHQLRGRIGRGQHDSLCILVAEPSNDDAQARMEAIVSTTDGFVIAQKDLEIRGPGYFFGRHQHGLGELKIANPATQMDVLKLAREEAILLTEEDPKLDKNSKVKDVILRRYPTYLQNIEAG